MELQFYNQCPSILAQQYPIVNAIMIIHQHKLPTQMPNGTYTIQLAQLSLLLQQDISTVQRDLLRLKWYKQCHIKWCEPALCIQIQHVPSDTEINNMTTSVYNMFQQQEYGQLQKISLLTQILSNVIVDQWTQSYPSKTNTNAATDIESILSTGDQQSQFIHGMINEYLLCNNINELTSIYNTSQYKLSQLCQSASNQLKSFITQIQSTGNNQLCSSSIKITTAPPATLLPDMYTFVLSNRNVTVLQLSRIAMGLSSPMYSADDWRNNELWGKYKSLQFAVLQQYAQHVITNIQQKLIDKQLGDHVDDERAGIKMLHQQHSKTITVKPINNIEDVDVNNSDEEAEILISDSE